jgi:DNA-directed RNA polymerase specialized sigma24 family protein
MDTTGVAEPAVPNEGDAHCVDIARVESILGGSDAAWHEFIDRYSGLVISVIHRYIPSRRHDEVRTLYADVLASLYRGKLASYAGRSSLSTWLVLVTRSAVVDHLRRRLGGRELREALRELEPLEREVFRLYYLEGLSFGTALGMLRGRSPDITADRLLLALQRIEEQLRGRRGRKLRYELHAQSVSGASGRLLEYLDHVQSEFCGADEAANPEYAMMEREARSTVERVMAEIALLPDDERQLLSLRFDRGWSARRIADELGLVNQRSVYTVIERVVRALRRVLGPTPAPRAVAVQKASRPVLPEITPVPAPEPVLAETPKGP